MPVKDFREWISKLETEGELKRIEVKVDWDLEIAEVVRAAASRRGPALLFENIKDYEKGRCTRLFTGGLGSRRRIAMMLGLPKDTSREEIHRVVKKGMKEPIKPVRVTKGPVKENVVTGDQVNLFEFPVPKWHPLDAGRYINTFCGVVTRDPDTGVHNVGVYRGMILDRTKIGVMLIPSQHWGIHYSKYKGLQKPMPVAVVYGWDDVLPFVGGMPLSAAVCEYDVMGGLRQAPVELIGCETSDIEVPASAEIVVEGFISPDPDTYELEGPFGEASGFYGDANTRPVLKVGCITHRDNPIYRGQLEGMKAGVAGEGDYMGMYGQTAILWDIMESQGVPGVVDIGMRWSFVAVSIHKTFQGQAKQVAAALWGNQVSLSFVKTVMVVEENVDVNNLSALHHAFENYVDPKEDIIVFPGGGGSNLDPSISYELRDEIKYGSAVQNKVLIDATINWLRHPERKEWGNKRYSPECTEGSPEVQQLVERRWKEYGID
ncbi:MAG: UbiD family decarboxylase [Deltaproteobacteria bacterium]|nr:MAG: UbiD family decarboxylase [Deltaproteobacteria bacterium]